MTELDYTDFVRTTGLQPPSWLGVERPTAPERTSAYNYSHNFGTVALDGVSDTVLVAGPDYEWPEDVPFGD